MKKFNKNLFNTSEWWEVVQQAKELSKIREDFAKRVSRLMSKMGVHDALYTAYLNWTPDASPTEWEELDATDFR